MQQKQYSSSVVHKNLHTHEMFYLRSENCSPQAKLLKYSLSKIMYANINQPSPCHIEQVTHKNNDDELTTIDAWENKKQIMIGRVYMSNSMTDIGAMTCHA